MDLDSDLRDMDLDLVTGDNDNVGKSHEVRNDFMRFFII